MKPQIVFPNDLGAAVRGLRCNGHPEVLFALILPLLLTVSCASTPEAETQQPKVVAAPAQAGPAQPAPRPPPVSQQAPAQPVYSQSAPAQTAAPRYAPAPSSSSVASAAPASTPIPPPSAPAKLATNELEKLVIPIALHPDPLISIMLPASVYPLEIVQAARFVRDTNNIPKVDEQSWDASVKAVAKFPELIAMMDADLEWTMKLGQAFLDQPKELMDAIQDLRAKAQKAGTLRTTDQQIVNVTNIVVLQTNHTEVVTVTKEIVEVVPANPQVIYVPSYPPTVYYPPPAYVYNPYAPLVTFGVGMMWGAAISHWHNDWHGGCVYNDVDVDIDRNVDRERNVNRGERPTQQGNRASARPTQQKWQPDQSRLRSSGAPSAATREARGWGGSGQAGGGARASTGAIGTRPSTGAGARPSTGSISQRPTSSPRPANRSASTANRGSPSSRQGSYGGSGSRGGSAFSGMNSGSSTRSFSNRGASSRSGGFGGSRGGGGRGGGRGR